MPAGSIVIEMPTARQWWLTVQIRTLKILHMLACAMPRHSETPATVTKNVTNFSPTHAKTDWPHNPKVEGSNPTHATNIF
jgi:hypothetical protein